MEPAPPGPAQCPRHPGRGTGGHGSPCPPQRFRQQPARLPPLLAAKTGKWSGLVRALQPPGSVQPYFHPPPSPSLQGTAPPRSPPLPGAPSTGLGTPYKKPFSTLPCVPITPAMGRRDPRGFPQLRGDPKPPRCLGTVPGHGLTPHGGAERGGHEPAQHAHPRPRRPRSPGPAPGFKAEPGPSPGEGRSRHHVVPDGAHGIGWILSGEPHRLGSGVLGESWGLLTTQERGTCASSSSTTHPIPPKGFGGSPNAGLHPSPAVGFVPHQPHLHPTESPLGKAVPIRSSPPAGSCPHSLARLTP